MSLVQVGGIHRRLGWKPDLPDHEDQGRMFLSAVKALPPDASVKSLMPRVEDQGQIGSCTAHAVTSAMEFLYRKLGRSPDIQLSRLFVYFATRVWIERGSPSADSGASIRDAMKAAAAFGACLEASWPYDGKGEGFAVTPSPAARAEAMDHQITSYRRCGSLTAIKQSIVEGYPVVGGFSCPASIESAETARTGKVRLPEPGEAIVGGHAVLFCGYDDKTGCLEFENSWGALWGNEGFGLLPYRFVTGGLATDFWTARGEEMP